MSGYRSTGFNKRKYVEQKIRAWIHHKQMAELIPDNENVFKPRIKADAVIIIRLRDQPQMQFSTYRTPFGWTVSPTLAGRKVQQILLHA